MAYGQNAPSCDPLIPGFKYSHLFKKVKKKNVLNHDMYPYFSTADVGHSIRVILHISNIPITIITQQLKNLARG